ncbi:MAG: VWA domain-containing protein [Gimesia sp.]
MSFNLLNPMMLLGLLGITLPILVHLLSRKRYDIIQWGAMQFLELGRRTKQRIRLEGWLLLAIRMLLIALITLALARPWISGGFLSKFISMHSRDIVFVIDGSYSMGWEGEAATPHSAAIQWVHRFLEELNPGDTISIIDARDQPRLVTESPTHQFELVREKLNELPPPSGSSNLPNAISKAIQTLSKTSNLKREIILLTDDQAFCWNPQDTILWEQVNDLLQQSAVPINLWATNVAEEKNQGLQSNLRVDKLKLSREVCVKNLPVKISTTIRYDGPEPTRICPVYFEIDGQRINEKTQSVKIENHGEAAVEFQYRFDVEGTHVVSIVIDADQLPGDDQSDAALHVTSALPVLLVDGTPSFDSTRSEVFFANFALMAPTNRTPWIQTTIIDKAQLTAEILKNQAVVILANVDALSEQQAGALIDFVHHEGGGVMIALGDQVNAEQYQKLLFHSKGLIPLKIKTLESNRGADIGTLVQIKPDSLQTPWLTRFRGTYANGFTSARFHHWWDVAILENPELPIPELPIDDQSDQPDIKAPSTPVVIARLSNERPLMLLMNHERGRVLVSTSSLDADWNNLPAKPDYVPFLHEAVFELSSGRVFRNIDTNEPIVVSVPANTTIDQFEFLDPNNEPVTGSIESTTTGTTFHYQNTSLPGIYALNPKAGIETELSADRFVVNFDRSESDLTPLSEADQKTLTEEYQLTFFTTLDDLKQAMFSDVSETEFWRVLLLIFLLLMVGELFLTRRLVQGGHTALPEEAE